MSLKMLTFAKSPNFELLSLAPSRRNGDSAGGFSDFRQSRKSPPLAYCLYGWKKGFCDCLNRAEFDS
jgi:hypothetical protein